MENEGEGRMKREEGGEGWRQRTEEKEEEGGGGRRREDGGRGGGKSKVFFFLTRYLFGTYQSLTKSRHNSVSFSKEQHVASRYLKLNMDSLKKINTGTRNL